MILVTASSLEYLPLAAITDPNKSKYAKKWGHRFLPLLHSSPWKFEERLDYLIDVLSGSDWIFFTGTDAAITNDSIDAYSIADGPYDLIISCDGNGFNADSWIMRNCYECRNLLHQARHWANPEPGYMEQGRIMSLLTGLNTYEEMYNQSGGRQGILDASPSQFAYFQHIFNRSLVRVKVVPQRTLNAYPAKVYGMPADQPWAWHPGDFLMHMPARPMEIRLKVFSEVVTGNYESVV